MAIGEAQFDIENQGFVKEKQMSKLELSVCSIQSQDSQVDMRLKQMKNSNKLDLSDCNITTTTLEMIAEKLSKGVSLEELSICNATLNQTVANTIFILLKDISSLITLKLSNNDINDAALNGIKAIISHNHLTELDVSCNKFTADSIVQIVQAVSVVKQIKILNISKNFRNNSSSEAVEKLSSALANCYTLLELNISNNSLSFNNVLIIAQAVRNLSDLEIFNISNNITYYYLECEFLIDVILSVNQSLTNIDVCGRNIRPRFNGNCLFSPLNCIENSKRFVLQNLYFMQHIVMNKCDQMESCVPPTDLEFIGIDEKCPFPDENIICYYVDHNGGTFYNEDHNFAIVIPPGAISQGKIVQIQFTASRFCPDALLNGCSGYYPVSSYLWVGAQYKFRVPVYLIMSHYAVIRYSEDIKSLYLLQSCDHGLCSNETKTKLVSDGVYFDNEIEYCIVTTDHFCSFCLLKNKISIPERFSGFFYTYDTDKKHIAEVCFCPATHECRKVYSYIFICMSIYYIYIELVN